MASCSFTNLVIRMTSICQLGHTSVPVYLRRLMETLGKVSNKREERMGFRGVVLMDWSISMVGHFAVAWGRRLACDNRSHMIALHQQVHLNGKVQTVVSVNCGSLLLYHHFSSCLNVPIDLKNYIHSSPNMNLVLHVTVSK
jgi:hypothetical protein